MMYRDHKVVHERLADGTTFTGVDLPDAEYVPTTRVTATYPDGRRYACVGVSYADAKNEIERQREADVRLAEKERKFLYGLVYPPVTARKFGKAGYRRLYEKAKALKVFTGDVRAMDATLSKDSYTADHGTRNRKDLNPMKTTVKYSYEIRPRTGGSGRWLSTVESRVFDTIEEMKAYRDPYSGDGYGAFKHIEYRPVRITTKVKPLDQEVPKEVLGLVEALDNAEKAGLKPVLDFRNGTETIVTQQGDVVRTRRPDGKVDWLPRRKESPDSLGRLFRNVSLY